MNLKIIPIINTTKKYPSFAIKDTVNGSIEQNAWVLIEEIVPNIQEHLFPAIALIEEATTFED